MPNSKLACILALLLVFSGALASQARAADRVYWANYSGNKISFANLDGSGGGDLATAGATVSNPFGVGVDLATGRIYWASYAASKISFANLDGSGGAGDLNTVGATLDHPEGLAIDPAARRVYWANNGVDTISFARLDGTGGGDINSTGATATGLIGLAIDPVGGRVWWTGSNKISFANLDGSGGADLPVTGTTLNNPEGLAIDRAAGRIYWANFGASKISFANLDGSGGGDFVTTGATVADPASVAADPEGGRIWWTNEVNGKISFARLDNTGGGGDVATTGATTDAPEGLALVEAPRAAGAPVITGGSEPGAVLTCSQGSWADDLPSMFLYRAPGSFGFQWSRGGADIAGASASSFTAEVPGSYRCSVSTSNVAGAASQASADHVVAPLTFGAKTLVSIALVSRRIPASGPVSVRIRNRNRFAVLGRLSGRTAGKVEASRRRVVKLKARRFTVNASARRTVKLKLPLALRRLLARDHKLSLRVTATVTDPAGRKRTVSKKLTPRLRAR